jgi:hypothetical protein
MTDSTLSSEEQMEASADPMAEHVAENLQHVRQRMGEAALRAGRNPHEVTLVAVSKTKPLSLIEAALKAGQRDFGENRFEEALAKVEESQERDLTGIIWHFVGTIQSRKTTQAVGPFALVHSVDRLKIANRLHRDAETLDDVLSVLLQVNVSGEESKHGFAPDELMRIMPQLAELTGLRIQGLMTMAPLVANPEETRPIFRRLRELRDRLSDAHPQFTLPHLSMGMTNDFEVAIEEGATIVRIGSAIFGERDQR